MAERFDLFRLSLLPRPQVDIESAKFRDFTREDWLRHVFSQEHRFQHYSSEFCFVPAQEDYGETSIGRIGRHVFKEENMPPERGLEDYTRETWIASIVVLDPSHHQDGQKMAVQNMPEVGSPSSLVRGLIQVVNETYPHGPYDIEAGAIIEPQGFWNFVSENQGNVTSVTLDFIAPNMFGSDDEFEDEMREYRDREHARKVRVSLQNNDGLEPDTDRMHRAVDYASKSGGRIRARAKDNKRFNSKDDAKRTQLDDVRAKGVELIRVAAEFANKILGRE